ncbi:hypothetical protein LOTGIDRAFT_166468 [Lottia gigantea]|uniref:Fucolectin tachylectin-4 pentraxin-1 domain-containing protein n=1 Tax=Lottia gigantea TaxID=225164 RepID=V3ZT95_LOTGI|nr:hypothetical protein LOTGIDRAFT_166468 [Lottia gigantea]ESO87587.1 hypothetical protein LOTGIDRAFT_166468 [Lottia gigantea]
MELKLRFLLLFILSFCCEGLQVCKDKLTATYCSSQCPKSFADIWKITYCMKTCRYCTSETIDKTWNIDNYIKTCRYCTSENIALGKETRQSSIYTNNGRKKSVSSNAVDGNTDSDYRSGSCTHTKNHKDPWWCVDLQSTQQFQSIILYNRKTNKERLKGFSIKVSETGECDQSTFESSQVCYKDRSSRSEDIYAVDNCNITEGQFIFITVPTGIVSVCEVEIQQGDLLHYNIVKLIVHVFVINI